MRTAAAWRAGAASDTGLARPNNEDRVMVDEVRGIFLVVDGLGGHAAGETAAETAVRVIGEMLQSPAPEAELDEQIKQAICAANNEIFRLAQSNQEWAGMACVLTLAVAQQDRIHVGHVGDSRLYLLWNGKLKKLTSDHSPVGELEDQGELTEEQAMQHPRRNEVFRDVGSAHRQAQDDGFIETMSFLFRGDAALLLCSDGLSDYVTAAEMTAILEQYDGDPARTAQQLVEAANAEGGRDNISTVFVAGADFVGSDSTRSQAARARHATTRMRNKQGRGPRLLLYAGLLVIGMAIGMLGWRLVDHLAGTTPAPVKEEPAPAVRTPRNIQVNAANARGILEALSMAVAGDTVTVPPGEYLGPLELKDHVNIVATVARQAIVRSDPAATADQGVGIVARHVQEAEVKGLRVTGDDLHPLKTGILIADSSPEIADVEVTGAIDAGVRIEGDSHPLLLGDSVHGNAGAGVVIRDHAAPRLTGNRISENGLAGIDKGTDAAPVLENNSTAGNGAKKK
jgi:parallel beta-helix repeat protein